MYKNKLMTKNFLSLQIFINTLFYLKKNIYYKFFHSLIFYVKYMNIYICNDNKLFKTHFKTYNTFLTNNIF